MSSHEVTNDEGDRMSIEVSEIHEDRPFVSVALDRCDGGRGCVCISPAQARELAQWILREVPEQRIQDPSWPCPVCGEEVTYGDKCEHVYFDPQTYIGPVPYAKYRNIVAEAEESGDAG